MRNANGMGSVYSLNTRKNKRKLKRNKKTAPTPIGAVEQAQTDQSQLY